MGRPKKNTTIQVSIGGAVRTRDRERVLVMPAPASPALDERIPGLLLDALAPVEAAIASAAIGAPYTAMRAAMDVDEERRRELARAAQAAAAAHPDFFAKHRSAFEFLAAFTAISAARMDHLLTLVDAEQAGAGLEPEPCSARGALVIGAIVLAPVLLLVAGSVVYQLLKGK